VALPGDNRVGSPRGRTLAIGLMFGAIVLCTAALAFWGGYRLAGERPSPQALHALQALQTLQGERDGLADALANALAEANKQAILCERTREIDRERDLVAQAELKAAQDERLALAREVFSLKRVIREGGKGVVAVQDLRLASTEAQREFSYSFTLTQLVEEFGPSKGGIEIKLTGKRGSKDETLSLKQLKGSKPNKLTMDFEHFQNLEGRLVLPQGFEPHTLVVEVNPKGEKLVGSVETFPWRPGD